MPAKKGMTAAAFFFLSLFSPLLMLLPWCLLLLLFSSFFLSHRSRRVQLHRTKVGALEASSSKLLDLPPLSVTDVYVRRLGARSIKQVAQGTSDDVRSIGAFLPSHALVKDVSNSF